MYITIADKIRLTTTISSEQIRNLCEGIFIRGLVAKAFIIIVAPNLKERKKKIQNILFKM